MKISVAMCTFNGEQFIKEQIDSILNQTLKVDEIIVCDDGSSDKTIEILNNYSVNNSNLFKIYINEVNLKSLKNFEKAISLCSGDIIFLSDQDDIWELNKVEDYLIYFNEHPNIDVLASNGFCIDEKSEIQKKYAIWDGPLFLIENNIKFNYSSLITYVSNIATGASMAIRKEIISEIFPFPIIENFHHDEWIAMISSAQNKFELLNKKYFYYRIHNNQQVGGVFYEKTPDKKIFLTQLFNLQDDNIQFSILKKRLSKIAKFNKLNVKLLNTNSKHQIIFKQNIREITFFHSENKRKMTNKYPISSFLLNLSDTIFNKRNLK